MKHKYNMNRKERDHKNAFLLKIVAEKNGKSVRSVRRYVRGDIDNDAVLADLDDLKRAVDRVIEDYRKNRLVEAVEDLIGL